MKKLNHLEVREIRNGCIVHMDGSLHLILEVSIPKDSSHRIPAHTQNNHPHNQPPQPDQLKIFTTLLSELQGPIQITARTVNLDMQQNLLRYKSRIAHTLRNSKKITKNSKDHLAQFSRFMKWCEHFILTNTTPQRLYYITLPLNASYKHHWQQRRAALFEHHQEILSKRVQTVVSHLTQAGFNTKLLNESQVVNLYSSYYLFSFYHDAGYYLTIEQCYAAWKQSECEE